MRRLILSAGRPSTLTRAVLSLYFCFLCSRPPHVHPKRESIMYTILARRFGLCADIYRELEVRVGRSYLRSWISLGYHVIVHATLFAPPRVHIYGTYNVLGSVGRSLGGRGKYIDEKWVTEFIAGGRDIRETKCTRHLPSVACFLPAARRPLHFRIYSSPGNLIL